jgi:lipopolysaccharide export LptBFGC system permease protein LptF
MADSWKRLLWTTLICLATAFGVLLVYSMITYSTELVIELLKWDWIFANTWAELLALAPVAQAWAALLVFGWLVPAGGVAGAGGKSSVERFASSLMTLLALALLFAVLYLVLHPIAARKRSDCVFTTQVAENLLADANEAESSQDYEQAVTSLTQYNLITRNRDEDARNRLRELRDKARPEAVRAAVDLGIEPSLPTGADASDLLDRAVAALAEDDYSTAHYMATLARALEPGNGEAARVAAESLRHIEASGPTDSEDAQTAFFRDLLAAKDAIGRGDYIDAYYDLLRLQELQPRNLDVQRYLAIAADRAADVAVFQDEVTTALASSSSQDLLFVNERTSEYTELIYIGTLISYQGVVYARRVEVMRFNPAGQVVRYLTSDYGKLENDHLILRVVDRTNRAIPTEPRYLVGAPPRLDGFIEITPTANDLLVLVAASRDPQAASVADLTRAIGLFEEHGLLTEPLRIELYMRLATPFTYVLMGLFAMGFGWRYRTRYLDQPVVATALAVPLVLLLLVPAYSALYYMQRVLLSTFLLAAGAGSAIPLGIGLEAVLLVLGVGYLALSTRE